MKSETSELAAAVDAMQDAKKDELMKSTTQIFEDIIGTKVNNIVPEVIFKDYFLEHFHNMIVKGIDSDQGAPLTLKWIELAGGPYNQVDVVDELGNVIYTIPSLYNKVSIDPKTQKAFNFSQVIGTFEAKSNRLPVDGVNYLSRELSSIRAAIVTDTSSKSVWLSVFGRYMGGNAKTSALNKVLPKEVRDAYDYD